MRVSKEHIENHCRGRGKRPFVFLVMLKRDNPRGFVYRENIKNLPSTYKKSKSTINRYLRYLKDNDFIHFDGKGNIKLRNIQTRGYNNSFLRTKVNVTDNDTYSIVEAKLLALILKEQLKQCQFMSRLKEESVKMHTKGYRLQYFKNPKRIRKIQRKYPEIFPFDKNPNRPETRELTDYNSKLILSDRRASEMLYMSEKTYNRTIKKTFSKYGILNWESRLIQLPFSAAVHEYDPMFSFQHKGIAYCSETEYYLDGAPVNGEYKVIVKEDTVKGLPNSISIKGYSVEGNLGKVPRA